MDLVEQDFPAEEGGIIAQFGGQDGGLQRPTRHKSVEVLQDGGEDNFATAQDAAAEHDDLGIERQDSVLHHDTPDAKALVEQGLRTSVAFGGEAEERFEVDLLRDRQGTSDKIRPHPCPFSQSGGRGKVLGTADIAAASDGVIVGNRRVTEQCGRAIICSPEKPAGGQDGATDARPESEHDGVAFSPRDTAGGLTKQRQPQIVFKRKRKTEPLATPCTEIDVGRSRKFSEFAMHPGLLGIGDEGKRQGDADAVLKGVPLSLQERFPKSSDGLKLIGHPLLRLDLETGAGPDSSSTNKAKLDAGAPEIGNEDHGASFRSSVRVKRALT